MCFGLDCLISSYHRSVRVIPGARLTGLAPHGKGTSAFGMFKRKRKMPKKVEFTPVVRSAVAARDLKIFPSTSLYNSSALRIGPA